MAIYSTKNEMFEAFKRDMIKRAKRQAIADAKKDEEEYMEEREEALKYAHNIDEEW